MEGLERLTPTTTRRPTLVMPLVVLRGLDARDETAKIKSEGFLRPSIPVNGGIRFHPDHSMDETFLNDSTDHMKSR